MQHENDDEEPTKTSKTLKENSKTVLNDEEYHFHKRNGKYVAQIRWTKSREDECV